MDKARSERWQSQWRYSEGAWDRFISTRITGVIIGTIIGTRHTRLYLIITRAVIPIANITYRTYVDAGQNAYLVPHNRGLQHEACRKTNSPGAWNIDRGQRGTAELGRIKYLEICKIYGNRDVTIQAARENYILVAMTNMKKFLP